VVGHGVEASIPKDGEPNSVLSESTPRAHAYAMRTPVASSWASLTSRGPKPGEIPLTGINRREKL
jgi:hypothetical protein